MGQQGSNSWPLGERTPDLVLKFDFLLLKDGENLLNTKNWNLLRQTHELKKKNY